MHKGGGGGGGGGGSRFIVPPAGLFATESAENWTSEESRGWCKAQHVTVTHPFGDRARLIVLHSGFRGRVLSLCATDFPCQFDLCPRLVHFCCCSSVL